MARPGAKPKPVKLRLVDGTHNVTRHGATAAAEKKAAAAEAAHGKLKKPTYLTGAAAWAWQRYIVPAGWLDATREAAAIAFCKAVTDSESLPCSRFTCERPLSAAGWPGRRLSTCSKHCVASS